MSSNVLECHSRVPAPSEEGGGNPVFSNKESRMVDRDLILSKAGLAEKYINRAIQKGKIDLSVFMKDIDCQDIVIFNLQKAIQGCIDIAAHIISDENLGLPGSNNEMFYLLEENGYLDRNLTEKMVKAVGQALFLMLTAPLP